MGVVNPDDCGVPAMERLPLPRADAEYVVCRYEVFAVREWRMDRTFKVFRVIWQIYISNQNVQYPKILKWQCWKKSADRLGRAAIGSLASSSVHMRIPTLRAVWEFNIKTRKLRMCPLLFLFRTGASPAVEFFTGRNWHTFPMFISNQNVKYPKILKWQMLNEMSGQRVRKVKFRRIYFARHSVCVLHWLLRCFSRVRLLLWLLA